MRTPETLAAQRYRAVQVRAENTISNIYRIHAAVAGCLMGINALSAFQAHAVVVGIKKTIFYFYVRTHVKVNTVATGSTQRPGRSGHAAIAYVKIATLIKMACPKWRITKSRAV